MAVLARGGYLLALWHKVRYPSYFNLPSTSFTIVTMQEDRHSFIAPILYRSWPLLRESCVLQLHAQQNFITGHGMKSLLHYIFEQLFSSSTIVLYCAAFSTLLILQSMKAPRLATLDQDSCSWFYWRSTFLSRPSLHYTICQFHPEQLNFLNRFWTR